MTISEAIQIATFIIAVGTSVVILARWSRKVESPPNGIDRRLRDVESDLKVFLQQSKMLDRRIDEVLRKASEPMNRVQAFIGEADDRYMTRRECNREHGRIGN